MMIDNTSYTPDNKFMVFDRSSTMRESQHVPVTLIDELLERGLSSFALSELMEYRAFSKDKKNIQKVKVSSLVGADLTGKNITIESDCYDFSTTLVTTSEALTVKRYPTEDNYYDFVFPEKVEDTEFHNRLFHHSDTVLISENLYEEESN